MSVLLLVLLACTVVGLGFYTLAVKPILTHFWII